MEQNRKVNLMKKKLWMLVCAFVLAFSITACGKTDQTSITFNGATYDQWKSEIQTATQQWGSASTENIDILACKIVFFFTSFKVASKSLIRSTFTLNIDVLALRYLSP